MISKPTIGIIAIVAILCIAMVSAVPFSFFGSDDVADTNTKEYNYNDVVHFRGANPGNELLNDDAYISSWQDGGLSTTITVNPEFMFSGYTLIKLENFYFKVYIKEADNAWTLISQPGATHTMVSGANPGTISLPGTTVSTNVWYDMRDYQFRLVGQHVGILKVEMYAVLNDWGGITQSEILAAKDEAYVYSGDGDISLSSGKTLFEIGESVGVNVKTGFSGQTVGEPYGWQVRMRSPDGDIMTTWQVADNKETTIKKIVTNDMWSDTSTNRYSFELVNTLISQDRCDFVTIDILANAPNDPVIILSDSLIEVGQSLTVEVRATIDPFTQESIRTINYVMFYGEGQPVYNNDQNWIIGSNSYVSKVPSMSGDTFFIKDTITPAHEGTITIKAYVVDQENRASEIVTSSFSVKNDEGDYVIVPVQPDSSSEVMNPIIISFIIAAIVGAVVILPIPIQPVIKMVVAIAGAVAIVLVFIL